MRRALWQYSDELTRHTGPGFWEGPFFPYGSCPAADYVVVVIAPLLGGQWFLGCGRSPVLQAETRAADEKSHA